MMVLVRFVVTMLASEGQSTEWPDRIPWQRGIAAILGLILVGALSYLLFTGAAIDNHAVIPLTAANSLTQVVKTQGYTHAFVLALFHGFAFPFDVTSLVIVVALFGSLVLCLTS